MKHLVGMLVGLVIVMLVTMILFSVVGYDPSPATIGPGFYRDRHFRQWLIVERREFREWVWIEELRIKEQLAEWGLVEESENIEGLTI